MSNLQSQHFKGRLIVEDQKQSGSYDLPQENTTKSLSNTQSMPLSIASDMAIIVKNEFEKIRNQHNKKL